MVRRLRVPLKTTAAGQPAASEQLTWLPACEGADVGRGGLEAQRRRNESHHCAITGLAVTRKASEDQGAGCQVAQVVATVL